MSNIHHGNVTPEIELEEHAQIAGVNGKKVFVIDNAGNQITQFGTATIALVPYSVYQQASLVSGYVYYGFASPGSNPTQLAFKLQREELSTGNVLFGSGSAQFIHQWSAASLASLTWR